VNGLRSLVIAETLFSWHRFSISFTHTGKVYLDRSFSPSSVVTKSIISPEAV